MASADSGRFLKAMTKKKPFIKTNTAIEQSLVVLFFNSVGKAKTYNGNFGTSQTLKKKQWTSCHFHQPKKPCAKQSTENKSFFLLGQSNQTLY